MFGRLALAIVSLLPLSACDVDTDGRDDAASEAASSCVQCHNGSKGHDYNGPGIANPHPFPGADNLKCITCHGGNDQGADKDTSHVPPPPEIGDREFQRMNRTAYFNRLTLTGIDKLPDYEASGKTYQALDYLQFVNPGDLRVAQAQRACGQCHAPHVDKVAAGLLATETGIFSGAMFAAGVDNSIPQHVGLFEDTAADLAFRKVVDPNHVHDPAKTGVVGVLEEVPVFSSRKDQGPDFLFKNQDITAASLVADLLTDNRCKTGSNLHKLYNEQVAFTCGDCHLGSAGANNRTGDYRSSGCTACHMPYSVDGRSRSRDPNVPKDEPADPDDIDEPERPHIRSHRIVSVNKTLPNGQKVEGMDDYTCAGCHQGSNRTVMQFWGIRLDQNQDVRNRRQYPANPVSFVTTRNDTRLFDPRWNNREFNGRNANQYLLFEDYDGDKRDDTPADVHHEAGMGCIDCHGSYDLHGGDVNVAGKDIKSRMKHGVAIQCESCHGGVDSFAATQTGLDYNGVSRDLAIDEKGNLLRHVYKESDGHYWMISRLTGKKHYVRQTIETIVDNGRLNPLTQEKLYSPKASYAMGKDDGLASTGVGPIQTGKSPTGFVHSKNMSCASCHSSWQNTCMGCHLEGEYNTGNNFSNITGDRIAFRERNADFVYQSPVPFQLGIGEDNKIRGVCSNTKMFFKYRDINGDFSKVFAFSDRKKEGNKPGTFPSLGHNAMMAHSIRGKVNPTNEGPRYCASCHLTTTWTQYQTEYNLFKTAIDNNQFGDLDFDVLKEHIGTNTNNHMESPFYVHMAAGLGTGLFLFDKDGCPQNLLDDFDGRKGCNNLSPKDRFDPAKVVFNLDRTVLPTGVSTGSSNHPMYEPGKLPNLRDGSTDPNMAGPLGLTLIQKLTDPVNGIVLNSWIDSDGS